MMYMDSIRCLLNIRKSLLFIAGSLSLRKVIHHTIQIILSRILYRGYYSYAKYSHSMSRSEKSQSK